MGWFSFFRSLRAADYGAPGELTLTRAAMVTEERETTLPRFKALATDSERGPLRAAGATEAARMRLQHAFTPSQPISDPRKFAGRRELLNSVIRAIEELKMHVVVFGERGIGKTSLLHVFAKIAREARYLVRYSSCSESSSFDATFRSVCRDIPLLFSRDVDPTADAAVHGRSLADMLPPGELTVAALTDAFAALEGTRVILLIDEFDRASSVDFRRSISELIKNLSDRSIRVQLVIAGIASNLPELFEFVPSIRRNIVGISVMPMDQEDLRELIGNGAARSGLPFEDDAADPLIYASTGSPYIAGLLGQQATGLAIDRGSERVDLQDVVGAIGRVLDDMKVRIPPLGQQQVKDVEAVGDPQSLALLAHRALLNFGFVSEEQIRSDVQRAVCRKALEVGLFVSEEFGHVKGYRIVDDSVAVYLWLHALFRMSVFPSK